MHPWYHRTGASSLARGDRVSLAQRLPTELTDFLALPGPQSLLVRGPPGSGKSTLCLALLEAAAGHRVLVTSRVSHADLARAFPWLGDDGAAHTIQIVDTSQSEERLRDVGMSMARRHELLDTGSPDSKAAAEFLWLPSAVQEAWSRLPENAPAIVVIDSWDALVEQYLGGTSGTPAVDLPDRGEVERILLRALCRSRAHVVIVLERREESQLDYLVNGVIVTQREVSNDRMERWLWLPKLRGIRIANAAYPYTVEAARFQCIEPIKPYTQLKRGPHEREPDVMPGHIWPGSRSFAENFGRLPVGKSTLVETDNEVPDYVLQMFLAPMMSSVVDQNGRVLFIPRPSLSAKEIWDGARVGAPQHKLDQGLRVMDVTGQLEGAARRAAPELAKIVLPVGSLNPADGQAQPPGSSPENEVSRFLASGGTGTPALAVVHIAGLTSLASTVGSPVTPDIVDSYPAMTQAALGSSGLHMIFVGQTGQPLFEALRSLAAIHLHLRVRQGRVFVYGSKPWTTGLVLTEGSETTAFDLLKIV
jgi:KaiC/GvpD/RAD55 family RecA-like ATPase